MIASFGDRATEALYHGVRGKAVKRIPPQITAVAVRKLDMLNSARALQDLLQPPGNRLEALRGDLRGVPQHSHQRAMANRVSGGRPSEAREVRIIDYYHR